MVNKLKNICEKFIKKIIRKLFLEQEIDKLYNNLLKDNIRIEISTDIAKFHDELSEEIFIFRKKLAKKIGLIIPSVRIVEENKLEKNEFKIFLSGQEIINEYTILKQELIKSDIIYYLENAIKNNISEILTNKIAEKYINLIWKVNIYSLIDIYFYINFSDIRIILVEILKNGKTIIDIEKIFEKIAYYAYLKNPKLIAKRICGELNDYNWDIKKEKIKIYFR